MVVTCASLLRWHTKFTLPDAQNRSDLARTDSVDYGAVL